MKTNKEIEDFRNDDNAMAEVLEHVKETKHKYDNLPLLSGLRELAEANKEISCPSLSELFSDQMKAHLKESMAAILEEFLTKISDIKFYMPPVAGFSNDFSQNIILAAEEDFRLSINAIHKEKLKAYKVESKNNISSRGVGFYGRHQLMYSMSDSDLTVSIYEYPLLDIVNTDSLDLSGLTCQLKRKVTLNTGDWIHLGPNETVMYDQCASDAELAIVEYLRDSYPFSLMFSADTLELRFQNPTNEAHSRLQLISTLLRMMDIQEAIPEIKKLLTHPQHFIRWHAMQELLGLDALQVLDELSDMAKNDPHPEVRHAATETMKLIEEMEMKNAS